MGVAGGSTCRTRDLPANSMRATLVGVRSADTGTPEQPVELTQPPLSGGRGGVMPGP